MNKIPLEDTISAAFQFLFKRILSIIGTVWLPMVLLAAVWGGIVYLVVPHEWWQGQFPILADKNPDLAMIWSMIRPLAIGFPLMGLAGLVLFSVMQVGLLRLSLGQSRRTFVFLSFGADVWRIVAASFLCGLTVMALYAAILILAIGGGEFVKHLKPEAAWIASIRIAA
jgi:hypothetical protein